MSDGEYEDAGVVGVWCVKIRWHELFILIFVGTDTINAAGMIEMNVEYWMTRVYRGEKKVSLDNFGITLVLFLCLLFSINISFEHFLFVSLPYSIFVLFRTIEIELVEMR